MSSSRRPPDTIFDVDGHTCAHEKSLEELEWGIARLGDWRTAGTPEPLTLDPHESEEEFRRKVATWRRVSVPKPKAGDRAGSIVFDENAEMRAEFEAILKDIHLLYRCGLETESGGGDGIIAAVEFACMLLKRLPLQRELTSLLLEPLLQVQTAIRAAKVGQPCKAFTPNQRAKHRPKNGATKEEFRIRCVFALEVLLRIAPGRDRRMASTVFQHAREAALSIGLRNFSADTILNWRRRHNTLWRRLTPLGHPDFDDDDPRCSECRRREMLELDLRGATADELANLREVYLSALAVGNVVRPLSMIGPKKSVC